MATHDFDAARKERLRERDPISFRLGGQTFTCLPVIPVGAVLDLEAAPEIDDDEARAAKELARFIDNTLVEADRERFQQLLRNRAEPIDGTALFQVAVFLAGEYTARPTSPSTGSSGGRGTDGATSSSPPDTTASATSET